MSIKGDFKMKFKGKKFISWLLTLALLLSLLPGMSVMAEESESPLSDVAVESTEITVPQGEEAGAVDDTQAAPAEEPDENPVEEPEEELIEEPEDPVEESEDDVPLTRGFRMFALASTSPEKWYAYSELTVDNFVMFKDANGSVYVSPKGSTHDVGVSRLLDGNTGTKFYTSTNSTNFTYADFSDHEISVTFHMNSAVIIDHLKIVSGDDTNNANYVQRNPTQWSLKAGDSADSCDTVLIENEPISATVSREENTYSFENTTAYQYYKFTITATAGAARSGHDTTNMSGATVVCQLQDVVLGGPKMPKHIDNGITFEPWTATNSLPTNGNYYLTDDVTISSKWRVSGTLNLCLNGKTVTSTCTNDDFISIDNGQTLSLYDCSDELQGKICRTGIAVGGIWVSGGHFKIYGGTVTDTAGNGINTGGGSFTMYGGCVTGFSCNTGAVNNANGGTLNLYGGSITGNKRGVNVANAVNVGGTVTVTGNTDENVYIASGKTITIAGALEDGAKIGVTAATLGTFTSDWTTIMLNADPADYFSSDNDAYDVFLSGGKVKISTPPHKHDESIVGGKAIFETAWSSTNSLPTAAGSYYLTADVTISSTWNVPSGTTNLCLNGHGICKTGSGSVITVGSGATLNLYDCGTATHYFNVYSPEGRATDVNDTSGAKNFTGGYITGGNTNVGGGVRVEGGTFTMYGGTILGNRADGNPNRCGGVDVNGGTFTMNGGAIQYNYGQNFGGGVAVMAGDFILNEGEISFNQAGSAGGGGIALRDSGKLYLYGGKIINNGNIAHWEQGGIDCGSNNCEFHIKGAPVVKDNTCDNGNKTCNITLRNNTPPIILDGALTTGASIHMHRNHGDRVFTSEWSTYMGTADPADYFVSDDASYGVVFTGTEAKIDVPPAAYVVVGSNFTNYGTIADAVNAWKSAADGATLKLCQDVTTTSSIDFSGTKTLDLNGYGIRYAGSGRGSVLISSTQNGNSNAANLTIIDSKPNTIHKISLTGYRGTAVEAVDELGTTSVDENGNGEVYVQGGYLTGGTGTLLSGSIYIGAAIYLRGANKTVTMNGGNLVGNACEFGGALHCSHGTFTLNGGNVIYNKGNGAAFNMDGQSKLYLYGGEIAHNTSGIRFATDNGSVLALANGTGSTEISDNKEYGIWINSGRSITIGGALMNTTPIGVTLGSKTGTFTSGWSTYMGTADPGDYFTGDDSIYGAVLSGGEALLKIVAVPEPTPNATFTATGANSGVLTNVEVCMQYSLNGGASWTAVSDTTEVISFGVTAEHGVLLYMLGNGTTTLDSDVQTISVTKAQTPSLAVTQPTVIDGTGSVNTTAVHEYSADGGVSWTDCAENQVFEAGNYLVRVKAAGTVLASAAQSVTVTKFISGAGSTEYVIGGNTVKTEVTVSGEETPAISVGNLDLEAETQSAGETSIVLTMSVEAQDATAAGASAEALEAIAERENTLEYLSVTIEQTVGATTTELAETQNVLEIIVPYSFVGKEFITVYRYHNGAAEKLTEADTGADGTFRLDKENGFVYIYAKKFSTYAIGYTQCFKLDGMIQYATFAGTTINVAILDEKNQIVANSNTTDGLGYSLTHIPKGKYTLRLTWTEYDVERSLESEIEIS